MPRTIDPTYHVLQEVPSAPEDLEDGLPRGRTFVLLTDENNPVKGAGNRKQAISAATEREGPFLVIQAKELQVINRKREVTDVFQ